MVKRMDRRRNFLIRGAATFVVFALVALVIRDRIKKRRPRVTYGPIWKRDQQRINYLNNKIFKCDVRCRNMLRIERAPFFRLCELRDSTHVSVEEQVAMFLNTIGHNLRNRVIGANFDRSNDTVSRYFRLVLNAIGELRAEYIKPPSLETPAKIAGNPRFDPYFKIHQGRRLAAIPTHPTPPALRRVAVPALPRRDIALPTVSAPGDSALQRRMHRPGDFKLPPFFNYPPYFTLQPVRETREKQVQLWKDLILDYCRTQKIYIVPLEEDFPLFSNSNIERSLSYEAKEVFLAALVNEGRAEWMDKGHKKCLILWLRIQDWANYILDFVRYNGLEVTTIEDIRSGIETTGTELAGIDRGVLMRALRLLEQKGKATIFKGTSADDEGVKFSV